MNKIKELCASTNEEILMKTIQKLPKNQQEAVKTCFDASKVASSNGRVIHLIGYMSVCL